MKSPVLQTDYIALDKSLPLMSNTGLPIGCHTIGPAFAKIPKKTTTTVSKKLIRKSQLKQIRYETLLDGGPIDRWNP